MSISPDDPRLAINQAAKLLDDQFIGVAATYWNAQSEVGRASVALRNAERRLSEARKALSLESSRLGADNAVPGRRVYDLLDAAYREMGLRS